MTDGLSQRDIEYGEGWACYKMDDKGRSPVISWAFIQGFCAALADHHGHGYDSIKDAFSDFFGDQVAQDLVGIAVVELDKDQEWFRWPNLKVS